MPHFSPISWLFTGMVFYLVLVLFFSLFWWMQSYNFPEFSMDKSSVKPLMWNWF